MKKIRLILLILAATLTIITCGPTEQVDLVISNTNVIDVIQGKTITGQDVIINGDKIQSIKPHEESPLKSKNLINGEGKFLIPGLWDMHVHTGDADIFFPLYVANGITGVRDMGGGLDQSTGNLSVKFEKLSAWRYEVTRGERLGPEFILAGAMIDGSPTYWPGNIGVTDSTSIHEAVSRQKELGVDFIKVYHNLDPEQLTEVAHASKKNNIRFAGHIPISFPPMETLIKASTLGQSSIEHMIQVQVAISQGDIQVHSFMDVADACQKIINRIDLEKEQRLYKVFKENDTWLTPTVSVWWGVGQLNQEQDEILGKWLQHIPKYIFTEWNRNPFQDTQSINHSAKDYETFREAALSMAKVAKRMFDSGVNLMAGSDSANPMIIPGYGLHKELELLVEGGFSPVEALRLATINPAKFLERTDVGQLAPNFKADIIILDKNPLDDIKNTTLISGVILRGKSINREKLDQMLSEAKSLVTKNIN